MKKLTLVVALSLIFQFGCKKQLEDKVNNNNNQNVSTTSAIKASADFKWNTFNACNFTYKALPKDVRTSVIKVMAPDGAVLFQKLHKLNTDLSFKLNLPLHYESVQVKIAGTNKSLSTKTAAIEIKAN